MSEPKKITGGWAFLNEPDTPAVAEAVAAAKSPPRPSPLKPAWAWLRRRKRWHGLVAAGGLLVVGFAVWFFAIRTPGPVADHAAIQGEWRVTRPGGTPGEDEGQMAVRVKGDRWTYVVAGREVTTWQVELSPDADPKEITLTMLEKDGQPIRVTGPVPKQLGVYAVDRKTLRIAVAPELIGRPKGLDDPDAPAIALTRVK